MRVTVSVVMVVMLLGLLIGCDTDSGGGKEWDNGKTVATEYRGIYVSSNRQAAYEFTTNKVISWHEYNQPGKAKNWTWPAWTEVGDDGEIELWVRGEMWQFNTDEPKGITEFVLGYFEDNTFKKTVGKNETFTKETE